MKQTRKDSETGEYQKIDVSPVGAARYLIFRNASNEQIGMTLRIVWRAIVLSTVAVMWGWTAQAGWPPPYYPLAEGKRAADQIRDLRIQALEASLVSTKKQQCTASSKGYATERLRELKRSYETVAGKGWDEPSCDEI